MDEPDTLELDGQQYCRLHHTPLVFDLAWAFSVFAEYTGIGSASARFPNAKWGHPATPEMAGHELVGLWHCPACETDRQSWLRSSRAGRPA
jgi:hypothetical protein